MVVVDRPNIVQVGISDQEAAFERPIERGALFAVGNNVKLLQLRPTDSVAMAIMILTRA